MSAFSFWRWAFRATSHLLRVTISGAYDLAFALESRAAALSEERPLKIEHSHSGVLAVRFKDERGRPIPTWTISGTNIFMNFAGMATGPYRSGRLVRLRPIYAEAPEIALRFTAELRGVRTRFCGVPSRSSCQRPSSFSDIASGKSDPPRQTGLKSRPQTKSKRFLKPTNDRSWPKAPEPQ